MSFRDIYGYKIPQENKDVAATTFVTKHLNS